MKKSKILKSVIIVLMVLLFFLKPFINYGQNAGVNLEKYWKYREALKNYLVVGNCQGCSIPARSRSNTGNIGWSDATAQLGYYIGVLAMEYYLEHNIGYDNHLSETSTELYYALEAINRLDMMAEFAWRKTSPYLQDPRVTNDPDYHTSDLNGFFIRDDVVIGLPTRDYSPYNSFLGVPTFPLPTDIYPTNYTYNADYLTASLIPPEDGWRAGTVTSAYNNACAYYYNGPLPHAETE